MIILLENSLDEGGPVQAEVLMNILTSDSKLKGLKYLTL